MTAATPQYNISVPVMVTGATGYVAGWLIARLLEEGFTVHATVRDPSDTSKSAHLTALANSNPGTLRFFKADLLGNGSYMEAMQGCDIVFHTASPFIVKVEDPQRDLIDPALNGTRNVLDSVNQTSTVKRVVLTSSCAAIYGTDADVEKTSGGILTEDDWNTSSTIDTNPYPYSKTLAERAAWDMANAQDRWKLVVINPALIMGPGIAAKQSSASFNYIKALGAGAFRNGVPPVDFGIVDVRDVAEAHLRAGFVPEAQGRHITYAEVRNFDWMADVIRAEFGTDWPLPDSSHEAGREPKWRADNSKSRRELGLVYSPASKAIVDMFQQQIDTGAFSKPV
jgi:nucleoside-diphosphate-sugar epimerase